MAGIRFRDLTERFVNALEFAGATVIQVSQPTARPLVLSLITEPQTFRLEVYLWAITPGGKGRNRPRERRIQLTGVEQFTLKAGTRTVLGGWSDEAGVFAFWDVRRHLGFSAGSPSLQISLDTLEQASVVGMATETRAVREGQEIAIGVHPDYLMWYLQEYERLYDCGGEVGNVGTLVESEPDEERAFIDSGPSDAAQSRRHQVIFVVRHFREARFRPLVLRAYSYRCCLTGMALRLVDAAHVVPVSDPTSTDDPRNGVALNPLMHRAFDCGLLGLLPGGITAINARLRDRLQRTRLDAGFELLQNMLPTRMTPPNSPEFQPPNDYFLRGALARGWTNEEVKAAC